MLVGKVGTVEIRFNDQGELRLWCLPGVQRLDAGDVGLLIEILRKASKESATRNAPCGALSES